MLHTCRSKVPPKEHGSTKRRRMLREPRSQIASDETFTAFDSLTGFGGQISSKLLVNSGGAPHGAILAALGGDLARESTKGRANRARSATVAAPVVRLSVSPTVCFGHTLITSRCKRGEETGHTGSGCPFSSSEESGVSKVMSGRQEYTIYIQETVWVYFVWMSFPDNCWTSCLFPRNMNTPR